MAKGFKDFMHINYFKLILIKKIRILTLPDLTRFFILLLRSFTNEYSERPRTFMNVR